MEKLEFDPRKFVDTVFEVINEHPADYRYPKMTSSSNGCQYYRDGAPSCLFGKVFDRLGVSRHKVHEGSGIMWNMQDVYGESLGARVVYGDKVIGENAAVLRAAFEAQSAQDAQAEYIYVHKVFRDTLIREGYTL